MAKRIVEIEVEDDEPEEVHEKWSATLIRGETYFLREIFFYAETPVVIAQHHKDHLMEHAVERVGSEDGETAEKQRFKFTPYDGPLDVGMPIDGKHVMDQTRDAHQILRMRDFNDKEEARRKAAAKQPVHATIPEPRNRVRPGAPPVANQDLADELDDYHETQEREMIEGAARSGDTVVEEVTRAPRPRIPPRARPR